MTRRRAEPPAGFLPGVREAHFPTREEQGKAWEEAWRARFDDSYRKLQERFGKGETYSSEARNLILKRVVPEWVFRGQLLSETEELRERCKKAELALVKLYTEIFPNER